MTPARLALVFRTALRLGTRNILRVILYRASCKLGKGPVSIKAPKISSGPFFADVELPHTPLEPVAFASFRWFGWYEHGSIQQGPPDWFFNPFNGARYPHTDKPWFLLPDFSSESGDIKCYWELSRFHWALWLAQKACSTGDRRHVGMLNDWLADWVSHNPCYFGPNWKCGQEASIRVLHLYFTARLLGQASHASESLRDLIGAHLQRIAPTLRYALSQDNNHGTSEAAALFVGGHWLSVNCDKWPLAPDWARAGRRALEERVARLVMEDGTFSQYSVNYHRLLLDTLCMVEIFRRDFSLPPFSAEFHRRAALAVRWLHAVTQTSGDAPNIGANDGAQLLPLCNTDYRDFRSSVQLASILFLEKRAYASGPYDLSAQWLGFAIPDAPLPVPVSQEFSVGGLVVIKRGVATLYLRFPRFRFRPSQADIFHVDLWVGDINLLRDAGTYSYGCAPPWLEYFSGISAHNTLQFGSREPMPRISRFLYGDWVEAEIIHPLQEDGGKHRWCGCYRDQMGAVHTRLVEMSETELLVIDDMVSSDQHATIRWHLVPSNWKLAQRTLTSDVCQIEISADEGIESVSLNTGWESRYYHQKAEIPTLEVVVSKSAKIKSHFKWAATV